MNREEERVEKLEYGSSFEKGIHKGCARKIDVFLAGFELSYLT